MFETTYSLTFVLNGEIAYSKMWLIFQKRWAIELLLYFHKRVQL